MTSNLSLFKCSINLVNQMIGTETIIYCNIADTVVYQTSFCTYVLIICTHQISSGISTSTTGSAETSTLTLSSVALTDAGTYTCTATYSLSDGSDPVVLTGTIGVTVRGFETHPVAQSVDVGSKIEMSCVVVGDQQASISW